MDYGGFPKEEVEGDGSQRPEGNLGGRCWALGWGHGLTEVLASVRMSVKVSKPRTSHIQDVLWGAAESISLEVISYWLLDALSPTIAPSQVTAL